jgi:hypothetical protein
MRGDGSGSAEPSRTSEPDEVLARAARLSAADVDDPQDAVKATFLGKA